LVFQIKTAQSEEDAEPFLDEYYSLLKNHIAHIAVIGRAIDLSLEDKKLGPTNTLKHIEKGLFDSIVNTADGLSPESAFDVITLAEENAILRQKKYPVLEIEHLERGASHYNIFKILTEDGYEGALFTNVTKPMRHIKQAD